MVSVGRIKTGARLFTTTSKLRVALVFEPAASVAVTSTLAEPFDCGVTVTVVWAPNCTSSTVATEASDDEAP